MISLRLISGSKFDNACRAERSIGIKGKEIIRNISGWNFGRVSIDIGPRSILSADGGKYSVGRKMHIEQIEGEVTSRAANIAMVIRKLTGVGPIGIDDCQPITGIIVWILWTGVIKLKGLSLAGYEEFNVFGNRSADR